MVMTSGEHQNTTAGEAAGLRMNLETDRRAGRLKGVVIAAVIWSFLYAALTMLVMVNVINKTNDTCESLSASRETVRQILISIEEITLDEDELIAALPPVEC